MAKRPMENRMRTRHFTFVLLLCVPAFTACSGPPAAPASAEVAQEQASSSAPTPVEAQAPRTPATACELVTATEMSEILGTVVSAEPNEGSSGKTECIYKPAEAPSPYVEFSVEWGEGETAMRAVGAMGQHEPGIASPYDGIGDQAAAVGPALMIRRGADLVTIVFSGVDDAPSTAKKIFDTANARM